MILPDRWKPSDGLSLEPNAILAAKEQNENLALTAGPGAGKTELLAQRADFLLRTGACRYPQRILAISFKVDAAGNLRERVRRRCGWDLAARFDSHTFHAFSKRLIDKFRVLLTGADTLSANYTVGDYRDENQITFKEMVPFALKILRNSDVARSVVRQTYSHAFLDEFQDCTKEQYSLVREIFMGSGIQLIAVGDTKQRIMGFAGALEGVFKEFASDFKAKPLNLYQNFRAQPGLRKILNEMVKVMDPPAAVKDIDTTNDESVVSVEMFSDSVDEAKIVANRIRDWIDSGVEPREIAVLVARQISLYADHLMVELNRHGVPFRNEQSEQDIAAEPAAKVVIDYLRVVVGHREVDAYTRLHGLLVVGAGSDDEHESRSTNWGRFLDRAREKAAAASPLTAADLRSMSEEFIKELGLDTLVALAPDYGHGARLHEILEETYQRLADHMAAPVDAMEALRRFSDDGGVKIMTIHKSKGLEFDSVVMLGVEKEAYWGKVDEERSVFFVGISRAKRQLLLTVAKRRAKPKGANAHWSVDRTPQNEYLGYIERAKE